jgi:hypothetical protein
MSLKQKAERTQLLALCRSFATAEITAKNSGLESDKIKADEAWGKVSPYVKGNMAKARMLAMSQVAAQYIGPQKP